MTEDSVLSVVRATFEEMTFLDVGPAGPNPAKVESGPILFLPYSHPRVGSLSLSMPKEIKFLSSENIYGESWKELSSEQIDDSLLELLNVLVGRLLTLHFGEQSGYVMGLPTVLFDEPIADHGAETQDFVFQIDAYQFHLTWSEVVP
ncbi:MAG: hypothetical protein WCG80_01315 [Spirochaetales bacterium]